MNTDTIDDLSFLNSAEFLGHWLGHRRVTRRVIEAFPEDKLFKYSVGGMRPFSAMVSEIISMSADGISGIATDHWKMESELDHHTKTNEADSKAGLLAQWDKLTDKINFLWQQIPISRFREKVCAFGQYEGEANGIILYLIDN